MRGIWHRPWSKRQYHLFVEVVGGAHPRGFLIVRSACSRIRKRGRVKFFDATWDPTPPVKAFPNCRSCLKAQKALRAKAAAEGNPA